MKLRTHTLRKVKAKQDILRLPVDKVMFDAIQKDDITELLVASRNGVQFSHHIDRYEWLKGAFDNMSFRVLRFLRAHGVEYAGVFEHFHPKCKVRVLGYASKSKERVVALLIAAQSPQKKKAQRALGLLCLEKDKALQDWLPNDLSVFDALKFATISGEEWPDSSLKNRLLFETLSTPYKAA
jgi:hypothetical protein